MIYRKKSFVKVYELRKMDEWHKMDELQTDEFRKMDELLKNG